MGLAPAELLDMLAANMRHSANSPAEGNQNLVGMVLTKTPETSNK
jgi:hypothetical protein